MFLLMCNETKHSQDLGKLVCEIRLTVSYCVFYYWNTADKWLSRPMEVCNTSNDRETGTEEGDKKEGVKRHRKEIDEREFSLFISRRSFNMI